MKFGPPVRDIALLARAGETLFGNQWQTDLSRALKLSDARRVRQWMSGERGIPAGVWNDIVRLLADRRIAIDALFAEFELSSVDMEIGKLPRATVRPRH